MFLVVTFYLTKCCCYPEKIYGRITIKCLTFFKNKSLTQHALKTALQEPFMKKESKLCGKEAGLTRAIMTDINKFLPCKLPWT